MYLPPRLWPFGKAEGILGGRVVWCGLSGKFFLHLQKFVILFPLFSDWWQGSATLGDSLPGSASASVACRVGDEVERASVSQWVNGRHTRPLQRPA